MEFCEKKQDLSCSEDYTFKMFCSDTIIDCSVTVIFDFIIHNQRRENRFSHKMMVYYRKDRQLSTSKCILLFTHWY